MEEKEDYDVKIAGILNLSGPVMGKTKQGVYKKFYPDNPDLPTFLVSTRKRQIQEPG